MAIWLVRAGSYGEYEQKFISEKRVYLTWHDLQIDIFKLSNKETLFKKIAEIRPDAK